MQLRLSETITRVACVKEGYISFEAELTHWSIHATVGVANRITHE
jgi:hypothetical protein